jgi:hypothetical protein
MRAYAVQAIPAGLALANLFTAIKFYPDPSRFAGLPSAFWICMAAAGLLAAGSSTFH